MLTVVFQVMDNKRLYTKQILLMGIKCCLNGLGRVRLKSHHLIAPVSWAYQLYVYIHLSSSFKQQHGRCFLKVFGEKAAADHEAAEAYFVE